MIETILMCVVFAHILAFDNNVNNNKEISTLVLLRCLISILNRIQAISDIPAQSLLFGYIAIIAANALVFTMTLVL